MDVSSFPEGCFQAINSLALPSCPLVSEHIPAARSRSLPCVPSHLPLACGGECPGNRGHPQHLPQVAESKTNHDHRAVRAHRCGQHTIYSRHRAQFS